MGKVIGYFKPKIKSANARTEKVNGCVLGLSVILLFAVLVYFGLFLVRQFLGWVPYIVVAAVLLKTTFAVKCMRQYSVPIMQAVADGDLDKARQMLHYIVRRDPSKLSERHIISATVESVAESTTDGVTSPFFYFALFGVSGAFAFRVVSTLDSMWGYRDREHVNIGWFSASLDTVANYVPARLTAGLMVVAVFLLGENWRQAWRILQRDRGNMVSLNAGWTIGVMAGALGVQLEKPGCYVLGDGEGISPRDILKALRIMELTAVLFGVVVVFPFLLLRAFVVFGVCVNWVF
jgi:adenosylcobinamide-phosphate synthase